MPIEGRVARTYRLCRPWLLYFSSMLRALPSSVDGLAFPYDALVKADVCVKVRVIWLGLCDPGSEDGIPKGGLNQLHALIIKLFFLNTERTLRVNSSCYSYLRNESENSVSEPPVMEYYYGQKCHPDMTYHQLDCCLKDNELQWSLFCRKWERQLCC